MLQPGSEEPREAAHPAAHTLYIGPNGEQQLATFGNGEAFDTAYYATYDSRKIYPVATTYSSGVLSEPSPYFQPELPFE